MKSIAVAVAIITDSQQRLLITQRGYQGPYGGLWEFPGGKIEDREKPEEALIREIKEEIGIDVEHHTFLGEVSHTYPEYKVNLFVFYVGDYRGEPSCCENQMNLRWALEEELKYFNFPAANEQVIKLYSNFKAG